VNENAMHRSLLLFLSVSLLACDAVVEVQTEPLSQNIQVLSAFTTVYAEVAVDIPPQAQGVPESITIESITATGQVINPSQNTRLNLSARLSFEGTAEPNVPQVWTQLNLPAYYAKAAVLLPAQDYAAGTTTPFTIDRGVLEQIVGKKRIWLIVSNTVTSPGVLDTFPLDLQLKDVVVRAVVTKEFRGLGAGPELMGL
jgi:hypothetical protein